MPTARTVCDGYDIATEHGVLHFDHEPTEVAAAIESLAAPEPERVEVIAEDGAVL